MVIIRFMSEEDVGKLIRRMVGQRREAREQVASLSLRLVQIGRAMAEAGSLLLAWPDPAGRLNEDVLLRKLREIPPVDEILALIAERFEAVRRVDEASEYLRAMGIEG